VGVGVVAMCALVDQPVRRRLVRWGRGALLGFSVVFNVLVSVKNYAVAGCSMGTILTTKGRVPEAIPIFEKALRISPDDADGHGNFAYALLQAGRAQEAIGEYEQSLRIKPDYAEAHYNLGFVLKKMDRTQEAIGQYEQSLKLRPDFATARDALKQLQADQKSR
jgi:tetratricopeptide (TPR) repeat protein